MSQPPNQPDPADAEKKVKGWVESAMDAWFEKKAKEQVPPPKRTDPPPAGAASVWESLFGQKL